MRLYITRGSHYMMHRKRKAASMKMRGAQDLKAATVTDALLTADAPALHHPATHPQQAGVVVHPQPNMNANQSWCSMTRMTHPQRRRTAISIGPQLRCCRLVPLNVDYSLAKKPVWSICVPMSHLYQEALGHLMHVWSVQVQVQVEVCLWGWRD